MKGGYSYHCACIRTKKGTVLGFGHSDELDHAEVKVIKKIKNKFNIKKLKNICKKEGGLILEVVRFDNKNHGFKLSIPCKECQKRINLCSGIVKVLHS